MAMKRLLSMPSGVVSSFGLFCRRMSTKKDLGDQTTGIKKLKTEKPVSQVTDSEWKSVLSPEEYEVTRHAGTEPKGGHFDKFFEKGRYVCTCCGAELFNSDSKYWSGCGWPAFSKSVDHDMNIVRISDNSYGMERTEVRCKSCNAHLGHVFDDGPKETGERYCINSVSMKFEPAD